MDACYGGLAITRSLNTGSMRFLKDMLRRYSRQVLTAGKANETVADSGGPIPNHSVFTGHLLQGLDGNAANSDGIITANTLMSYVYEKVSKDLHSQQTPHFGYLDGDGDFIFEATILKSLKKETTEDKDVLIEIESPLEQNNNIYTNDKVIERVKEYISDNRFRIKLEDTVNQEIRKLLVILNEENFPVNVDINPEILTERLKKYEAAINNLLGIIISLAHWGKQSHNSTIGNILIFLNEDRRAIGYLEKALQIIQEEEDYDVIMEVFVMDNLGRAYQNLCDYQSSINYYYDSFEIKVQNFKEDSTEIAISYMNLGSIFCELGDFGKSIDYLEKALKISNKEYGYVSSLTADILELIGLSWYYYGDYEKAYELLEESLSLEIKIFGEDDYTLISQLNNIGLVSSAKKEYKLALEYLEKAKMITESNYNEEYSDYATILGNLSIALFNLSDSDKAVKYYERALDIELKLLEKNKPEIAMNLNHIGNIWRELGEYEKAIKYQNIILTEKIAVYGFNHHEVIRTYTEIGINYSKLDEYEKALEYYNKAKELCINTYGEEFQDLVFIYSNLGNVYMLKGEYKKSEVYYKKALNIWEKFFGRDNSMYENIFTRLEYLKTFK